MNAAVESALARANVSAVSNAQVRETLKIVSQLIYTIFLRNIFGTEFTVIELYCCKNGTDLGRFYSSRNVGKKH